MDFSTLPLSLALCVGYLSSSGLQFGSSPLFSAVPAVTAWERNASKAFMQARSCPCLGGIATLRINVLSRSGQLFRFITVMVGFGGEGGGLPKDF